MLRKAKISVSANMASSRLASNSGLSNVFIQSNDVAQAQVEFIQNHDYLELTCAVENVKEKKS